MKTDIDPDFEYKDDKDFTMFLIKTLVPVFVAGMLIGAGIVCTMLYIFF